MSTEAVTDAITDGVKGAIVGATAAGPWGAVVGGVVGGFVGATTGTIRNDETQKKAYQEQQILNKEQAILDQQKANLERQKALAGEQYKLNIASEDAKYQEGDSQQLNSLLDRISNGNLTLDQKMALIDSEVKNGLGSESYKIAAAAREAAIRGQEISDKESQLAQQENAIFGVGGTVETNYKKLTNSLDNAKGGIDSMRNQRDAGISEGMNAANALGLSGQGVDAQVKATTYSANKQIASAARDAGYMVDVPEGSSTFDIALQTALSGKNLNQMAFDTQVQQYRNSYDQGLQEIRANKARLSGNIADLYGSVSDLVVMDQNYRSSASLARDNADIGFSQSSLGLESSQLQIDNSQWNLDNSNRLSNDYLTAIVLGIGNGVSGAESSYGAGKGALQFGKDMKWWS